MHACTLYASCFAGDERANEQSGLASYHTLFVRMHNILEPIIGSNNPNLNGEDRFQHTRRFMVALWQKLVFEDFAKVILGPTNHAAFNLGFNQGAYDPTLDPRLDAAFAVAAFRMGHTYVPDTLPFQERTLTQPSIHEKLSDVSKSVITVFSRASAHCKGQNLCCRYTSFYRGRLPGR